MFIIGITENRHINTTVGPVPNIVGTDSWGVTKAPEALLQIISTDFYRIKHW